MTEAVPKQSRPPPDVDAQTEENTAEIAILKDAVERLEILVGKICETLGVDPPPVTVVAETTTMKMIASDSGYSLTRVGQWVKAGRIKATWKGGRVLVDKASAKAFLDRKQDRAHKVKP